MEISEQDRADLTRLALMLTEDADASYTSLHFGPMRLQQGNAEYTEAEEYLAYLQRCIALLARIGGPDILPKDR